MALVAGSDVEYRTAKEFQTRCFGQGESFLVPGTPLWTTENLAAASSRLMSRDDKAGSSYIERLSAQLSEPQAPPELYALIAESMVLYYLFPASDIIRTTTKIDRINTVLSWAKSDTIAGRALQSGQLQSCFGHGIGNVGTHYLSAQPYLMNFFLIFALEAQRQSIDFDDKVQCQRVADEIKSQTKHVVEARHVLLHLFFPEHYESIASDTHKKKITARYGDLITEDGDLDQRLYRIREVLSAKLGQEVRYYDPALRREWDTKDHSPASSSSAAAIPSAEQLLLPYLQIVADGEAHREVDIVDALAASCSLPEGARDQRLSSGSVNIFDNRAKWAKEHLQEARLVEIVTAGHVRITDRGKKLLLEEPTDLTRESLRRFDEYVQFERDLTSNDHGVRPGNVWIEKTTTLNRADRLVGEFAVGAAIWSPQRDNAGRDSYRFMRDVRPGDVILHFTDNKGFTGVSIANSSAEEFEGVSGTQWGDRPCYVVRLKDYRALIPPLLKETLFGNPYRDSLVAIRKRERNLFYTEGVRLEGLRSLEGFYLTPAPLELVATINQAYTDLTGKALLEFVSHDLPSRHIVPAYTFEDLLRTTLWSEVDLNELLDVFSAHETTKQVILTGPPGTGKTWVAMQVVRYLTNADESRFRVVQLHPSYSYEQFVEGLRPVAVDGAISFKPVNGVLLDVASQCRGEREPYFLVMDEMNRANLARVLGELLYLFEYRQEKIDLPYTKNFTLPDNLYFIGTMNTADRSIRSIDAALRRRVEIFECLPSRAILEKYYDSNTNQVPDLFDGFERLNTVLEDMLDRHHTVGQTFFMAPVFSPAALRIAWRRKIRPLIEEYLFDRTAELKLFEIEAFWPSMK
jgi:hypothetical protein